MVVKLMAITSFMGCVSASHPVSRFSYLFKKNFSICFSLAQEKKIHDHEVKSAEEACGECSHRDGQRQAVLRLQHEIKKKRDA